MKGWSLNPQVFDIAVTSSLTPLGSSVAMKAYNK